MNGKPPLNTRALGRACAFALLLVVVIVAAISLSPIRWDVKTLGGIQPRGESRSLEPGRGLVLVTADQSLESWHLTEYGQDLVTFPHGQFAWIVFRENADSSWSLGRQPAALIDALGSFYAQDAEGAWVRTPGIPRAVQDALREADVVVPSEAVRAALLSRWKGPQPDRITVLASSRLSPWRSPGPGVDLVQSVRLLLLLLSISLLSFIVVRLGSDATPASRLLLSCYALPVWFAVHTTVVMATGLWTGNAMGWSLVLEVIAFGLLVLRIADRPGDSRAFGNAIPPLSAIGPVLVLGTLYVAITMFRRDADGDVFTHWLPMAASHHMLGHHDPAALLLRYGNGHKVNYPPGFPVLISTWMWIGDVPRGGNLLLGEKSNVAIFLFRLSISLLHASFLSALFVGFGGMVSRAKRAVALPVVVAIAFTIPLLLGQSTAAEIYIVPLYGFAMLAFACGADRRDQRLICVGLYLAAFGLVVKNESRIILLLVVAPWYLASLLATRPGWRSLRGHAVAVMMGLAPFIIWMAVVSRVTNNVNFMYRPVTVNGLIQGLPTLGAFAEAAFKILLADNLWFVFLALLPAAIIVQLMRRRARGSLLIPAGVFLHLGAMCAIYIFALSGPMITIRLAYERTVLVAALSALLFVFRELILDGESS